MRRRQPPQEFDRRPNDPTPEEIQRQCREIRRDWSEEVCRKRAGVQLVKYTVPVVWPYFEFEHYKEAG